MDEPEPWLRFKKTRKTLGRGGYGTVRIMVDSKTGQKVACKVMKACGDPDSEGGGDDSHPTPPSRARTIDYTSLREVGALLSLQGIPGIPRVLAVWPDRSANMHVVMEKMTCSLLDLVQKVPENCVDLDVARAIVGSTCRILRDINRGGFIHRDLKPENIMIKAVDSRVEAYVIDYGLSRSIAAPSTIRALRRGGGGGRVGGREPESVVASLSRRAWSPNAATRWYRAPEVLLFEPAYNRTVDMWSLGVILVEIVTGRCPFPGQTDEDQLRVIFEALGTPEKDELPMWDKYMMRTIRELGGRGGGEADEDGEVTRKMSADRRRLREDTVSRWERAMGSEAADFAMRCLRYDPAGRMTPEQALAHPFVSRLGFSETAASPCALDGDEELMETPARACPDFVRKKDFRWPEIMDLFAWMYFICEKLNQPRETAELACYNFIRCVLSPTMPPSEFPRRYIVACVCILLASKATTGNDAIPRHGGAMRDTVLATTCECTLRDMQAYEMAVLHEGLRFRIYMRTASSMIHNALYPCSESGTTPPPPGTWPKKNPRATPEEIRAYDRDRTYLLALAFLDAWIIVHPSDFLRRGRTRAVTRSIQTAKRALGLVENAETKSKSKSKSKSKLETETETETETELESGGKSDPTTVAQLVPHKVREFVLKTFLAQSPPSSTDELPKHAMEAMTTRHAAILRAAKSTTFLIVD